MKVIISGSPGLEHSDWLRGVTNIVQFVIWGGVPMMCGIMAGVVFTTSISDENVRFPSPFLTLSLEV